MTKRLTVDLPGRNRSGQDQFKLPVGTTMFLRPLSISLVLVGVVVASVNLHVQDSDSVKTQFPVLSTQTEVITYKHLG